MTTRENYLQAITEPEEIIPDLGNIIAGYTGGECDVNTQDGRLC